MPAKAVLPKRLWVVAGLAGAALACLLVCGLGAVWSYRAIVASGLLSSPEPPGQGERAERSYQACAPVIAALAAYRQAHGGYPATLATLVPNDLAAIPAAVNGYPIEYRRVAASYSLEFSYEKPGMHRCAYTPEKQWSCFGYY